MPWSSWSKHVFERDDSNAISCATSRQEKGGLHRCIARFITYSSPRRADTWFPSLPRKECTGVRYVITKFSRMDGLPNFLTRGAPLARFARRSPAINFDHKYNEYVIIKWSLWLPKGCYLLFSSRCQKVNFCYKSKRRLDNNTTYSFKVAFCSYHQSAFYVLLLFTSGITIITEFRDFGQGVLCKDVILNSVSEN